VSAKERVWTLKNKFTAGVLGKGNSQGGNLDDFTKARRTKAEPRKKKKTRRRKEKKRRFGTRLELVGWEKKSIRPKQVKPKGGGTAACEKTQTGGTRIMQDQKSTPLLARGGKKIGQKEIPAIG